MDAMFVAKFDAADADANAATDADANADADADAVAKADAKAAVEASLRWEKWARWARGDLLILYVGVLNFMYIMKDRIVHSAAEADLIHLSSCIKKVAIFYDSIAIQVNWKEILKDVEIFHNPGALMMAMKSYIQEWMDRLSDPDRDFKLRIVFCVFPPILEELPLGLKIKLLLTRKFLSFQNKMTMIFSNVPSLFEDKEGIRFFFHSDEGNFNIDLEKFIKDPCGGNSASVLQRDSEDSEDSEG